MRKLLMTAVIVGIMAGSSAVYAHISGSFGDFLVGIQDESTTANLKKELEATKAEIESLSPRVNHLEEAYKEQENIGVAKLQFYNTIGLDTFIKFALSSQDIIDVLGNQKLIEKKLEEDLQALNRLYLDYMQVKVTKESLEGHRDVLEMIEGNLQAREQFLQENQNLSPQALALRVSKYWNDYAGFVDEALAADSEIVNKELHQFITQKTPESPYRLEQNLLNQKSNVRYFIRSDHVYANFKNEKADVILIGIFAKDTADTASLKFEAGFINGIMVSHELIGQLSGFRINYSDINPKSNDFIVEQMNGAIVIQPAEQAVD